MRSKFGGLYLEQKDIMQEILYSFFIFPEPALIAISAVYALFTASVRQAAWIVDFWEFPP